MEYRQFGKLGKPVSALGLGTMRLPTIEIEGNKTVNEDDAIKLIRHCIDNGVNYIDTAWPYHEGQSEIVTGMALLDNYREKVVLATKMPCWMIDKESDFDKYLDEQLGKLQTGFVDFYLLHALFTDRWEKMLSLDVFKWADRAKRDGRIKHLGFSFHDGAKLFTDIIDSYDWDMCQIQYNYVNETVQAGTAGLNYAVQKGIPVVVMEPLLGGLLADPPGDMGNTIRNAGKNAVELALNWLWNKPEVSCVLSGMSSMQQANQNIELASRSKAESFSEADSTLVDKVKEIYSSFHSVPCTKCEYCQPCPSGVRIPRIFEIYNEGKLEGKHQSSQGMYNWHMKESEKAHNCTGCKDCESSCPQHIEIASLMPRIHEELAFQS